MRITSKQIAEMAGVSRGTVDRVLNHRGGVRLEVQKRIEELAEEYGYRPNRAGKALVTRDAIKIGVLLNSLGNPFFDEVKRGIEAAGKDYSDFPLSLEVRESKGYDIEAQLREIDALAAEKIQGLLITPINHPEVAKKLNLLIDGGCPVVALNTDVDNCRRLSYVGCDYLSSGRTAAQLMGLITKGRANVLIVTGSVQVLGHNQRMYAFSRVLRAAFPEIKIVDIVENGDDEALSACEVKKAMESHPEIDALYFTAAGVAGGVSAACEAAGGRRLAVITCDLPRGTRQLIEQDKIQVTIGQQPFLQGYNGVKILLSRLLFGQNPESPFAYTQNEIKVKYNL